MQRRVRALCLKLGIAVVGGSGVLAVLVGGTQGASAAPRSAPNSLTAAQEAAAVSQVNSLATQDPVGRGFTYAIRGDAAKNLVVDTNAPASIVRKLADIAGGRIVVNRVQGGLMSRRSDSEPFWGGAGITTSARRNFCSTGFPVVYRDGVVRMLTAAHCFRYQERIYALNSASAANLFGTVVAVQPSIDAEMIGGAQYRGRIFTAGLDSSSSIPVGGVDYLYGGSNNVCVSGVTTGENCGQRVYSLFARFCSGGTCFPDDIVLTGGRVAEGGDSGGAVYTVKGGRAYVVGILQGVLGNDNYVVRFDKISTTFGITGVVTG